MGFYSYFGRKLEYQRLNNCSLYDPNSVPLERRRDITFGVVLIFLGILLEFIYLPCIYALFKKKVRELGFCYELMLEMCLFGMCTTVCTSFMTAYFAIRSELLCTNSTTNYFASNIMYAFWIGYCQVQLVLAINRCLIFVDQRSTVFAPQRQLFWLVYPILCTLGIGVFGAAGVYNGVHSTWNFNPHFGYFEDTSGKYASLFHLIHNIAFTLVMICAYSYFLYQFLILFPRNNLQMPKSDYMLFVQTLTINAVTVLATVFYTFLIYIKVPDQFAIFSHIIWVIVEGMPPVVYLTSNQVIRRTLREDYDAYKQKRKRQTSEIRPNPNTASG